MKKNFKYYAAVWAVLVAVYNALVFTLPAICHDARFWISWGFIIAALVGQLICAGIAFRSENNGKLFLNIPLITQSYGGAVAITVIGSICVLIPGLPYWIAAIACLLVLAFGAVGVIKAKAAAAMVDGVGAKVKAQTFFIKALTVDAETLLARAGSDEIKAACQKVYEAVRYSDPMSNDALAGVEGQITVCFAKLTQAVAEKDAAAAKACSDELLILMNDRNKKCRLLK